MAGSETKWVSLGDYIEPIDRRNTGFVLGVDSVRGVSNTKEIMPTKASVDEKIIDKFLLIYPNEFVYNPRTTRMGEKIGLVYNNTKEPLLFTFNNLAFAIKDECKSLLLPDFLYLFFNRTAFDRYSRINSWGSATELFPFTEMQRVKIPLPSIEKQRQIVAEWKGLRAMKEQNEQIAQPLMQLCQSYLDKCKTSFRKTRIGDYINVNDITNSAGNDYPFIGLNKEKEFMPTVANTDSVDKRKYKVLSKDCFVFSGMQTGRDMCIRLGHYEEVHPALISPAYTTFLIPENDTFLADYVFLSFTRPEMDRYCAFMTDSSVRANLDWNRFLDIELPCPPIEVQQAIVNIYKSAQEAKKIAEEADKLSNEICPALIQHVIHS